jgi:hypothetical protein
MNFRRAFTVIESLVMMVTILVFTLILVAIMRQKKVWPLDRFDAWLDSMKKIENTSK